jgi:hypothetical protein
MLANKDLYKNLTPETAAAFLRDVRSRVTAD